jgi:hypothetical protein
LVDDEDNLPQGDPVPVKAFGFYLLACIVVSIGRIDRTHLGHIPAGSQPELSAFASEIGCICAFRPRVEVALHIISLRV